MTSGLDLVADTAEQRSRRRPTASVVVAMLVVVSIAACALAADLIAPHDPNRQNLLLGPSVPSGDHWLGTDELGRDVLSRLITGTRAAVVGPLIVAVATVLIGSSLGLIAGYAGGSLDTLISRFADLIYALPALLVVIVVVGVVDGGYPLAICLFVLFSVPTAVRLARSAALSEVRLPYVDAAKTLGLRPGRIVFRHVLPNIMPTVAATGLLDYVGALIGLSALSFLGLGVAAGSADWGLMLSDGRSMLDLNPWYAVAPATAIVLTAAAVTILGDWIYDRVSRQERD